MSGDDETEPMTRMLDTIAHTPHPTEPQQCADGADKTRLEIARPKPSSAEPATKIVHPSTFRQLSLETTTLPATPRTSLYDDIAVPRPRLSMSPQDEITALQPVPRRMPLVLAVLLAVVCLATAASLLW